MFRVLLVSTSMLVLISGIKAESANDTWNHLQSLQGNVTLLNNITAPAWVEESEMRGTWTVLWGCVVTLIACVYTALHLNIPDRNLSDIAVALGKFKWLCICLIAPEVVLYLAMDQFLKARKIAHDLKKQVQYQRAQGRNTDVQEGDSPFDLTYGFFVCMGGLEIIKPDGSCSVLSVEGIEWLGRRNAQALLVPRYTIMDGSKANAVQKGLVAVQVGWFLAQTIGRLVIGLPLCLLELHTIIHCGCAILMYVFWWQKPLDLPTTHKIALPDELMNELIAKNDDRKAKNDWARRVGHPMVYLHPLYHDEHRNLPGFRLKWLFTGWEHLMAYLFERKAFATFAPLAYGCSHLSAWNWAFPSFWEGLAWKASCVWICLSGIFLVGLYSARLNRDRRMFEVPARLPPFGQRPEDVPRPVRVFTQMFCVHLPVTIALPILIACRLYLVAESFACLRAVPIGIYWVPPWTKMIPHVS